MSSQPNGAWLTQDAYDRLAKELAELESAWKEYCEIGADMERQGLLLPGSVYSPLPPRAEASSTCRILPYPASFGINRNERV